ncbi:hypothetical protein IHE33_07975 [Mycetohabitans endofungorum]|uniref:hypothetical protein n=1 Tax=Mycetohabitans endofungorum TaxID=417203 RepID=UPI0030D2DED8
MATARKTGRNLLKNGTFEKNFLDHDNGWEAANPEDPGVAQEKDPATGLNYLYFERGIVQQRFALPVNPSKLDTTNNYGYQFSFQYQPTLFQGGEEPYAELRTWPSETQERVELPTAGSANRVATDDYTHWLSREVFFKSYEHGDTEFEVRLASGCNPEVSPSASEHERLEAPPQAAVKWPDIEGGLHVAGSSANPAEHPGVAMQLCLPPLTLLDGKVRIHFEGDTHAAPLLPDGRVPICRGAVHTMTLLPQEDNGWAGDEVYPGTDVYASCEPDQEAERLEVTLSATAPKPDGEQHVSVPWRITCGNQASGPLDIVIESIYNAEPFTLPCAVGHYQLAISEHPEPSHWPVIPLNETVQLAVRVRNPAANAPADDVTVQWEMPDGPSLSSTDNDGWAHCTFQPTQDNIIVEAIVDAPYNAEPDQYAFTVRAIPTLPWAQFEMYLDGHPIDEQPIDSNALDLSPGSDYELIIKPSIQSVLEGQSFYLAWGDNSSDPEEIGVSFEPPLGQERELTADGIQWTISCTDEASGRFRLQLCTRRLRCPLELNCWVADSYEIKDTDQQDVIPVLAWGETIDVKVQIFSLHTSRPVAGVVVKWTDSQTPPTEHSTTTDANGWAVWTYQPSVPGAQRLRATIEQPREQEPLKHDFNIEVLDKFDWSLFDVTLDGKTVNIEEGIIFILDEKDESLNIAPKNLALIGKSAKLDWIDGPYPGIDFFPPLGESKPIEDQGFDWKIRNVSASYGKSRLALSFDKISHSVEFDVKFILDLMPGEFRITDARCYQPHMAEDYTIELKWTSSENAVSYNVSTPAKSESGLDRTYFYVYYLETDYVGSRVTVTAISESGKSRTMEATLTW